MSGRITVSVCILLFAVIGVHADVTLDKLLSEKKFKEAIEHADSNIPAAKRTADVWVQLGAANEALGMTEKALACYLVSWRMNPKHYASLLGAAKIYNRLEQYDNAEKMAKAALEQQFTGEASWEYARACIALKRPAEAKQALEKVIETDAGNGVANRELGNIYFNDKQYKLAIPLLKKSLAKEKNADITLKIGQSFQNVGNMDSALVYIERAVAQGVKNPGIVLDLARVYFGRGQYTEAAQHFDKAAATADMTPLDQYNRAVAKEKNGDAAGALAAYRLAVTAFGSSRDKEALLAHLVVGKAAFDSKKYSDALGHFKAIAAGDPDASIVPEINFLLADVYQETKDVTNAISSLEKAIVRDSKNYEAYARLAGLYERNGMADKAKATYEKMMSLSPDDPKVYLVLGNFNLNSKKYADALSLFTKGNALKESAEAEEGIAKSAIALNQYDRAREAAKAAVGLDPARIDSRKILVDVYMRSREYGDARPHLEYLTAKESTVLQHWTQLAECYEGLKEAALLAKADRQIIALDKNNVDAHRRLARYEKAAGNKDAAYKHYKTVSLLDTKDAESFENLYKMAMANGQIGDATIFARKYLVLKPTDASAQRDLGDLYYEQKNFDGALDAYRAVIKLDNTIRGFYKRYAEVVIAKGLEQEVIKALTVLIESGDADLTTYTTLGMIYEKQKSYQKALDIYQKALQVDPANAGVLSAYASCQAKTGDVDGAIITYEQTVMIDPNSVEEYKDLGDLYTRQKKNGQAMKAYMNYLDKKEDPAIAKLAGDYAYGEKMWDKAATYFAMVRGNAARAFVFQLHYGEAAYYAGNYDVTIDLYTHLIKRHPKITTLRDITLMIAKAYEKQGKNLDAAKSYSAFVKLGAVDADAAYKSGLLQESANPAAAVDIYESNIKLYPEDARNFIRLGKMYSKDKAKLSLAVSMLKRAAAMADTVADVWLELAQVYGELGQVDDELAAYKEFARYEPQNAKVNKRMGVLLMKKGMITEGMVYLETANAVSPNDPAIMMALAEGYVKTNRRKEAADLLLKVKQARPKDTGVREKLFASYVKLSRVKEAEQEIADLVQLERKPAYILMYARFLREQGDLKKAESKVEDILATDPENIEALLLKGAILRGQKKYDDAVATYKEISFIDPDNAQALYERAETHRLQSKSQWAITFYQRTLRADPNFGLAELGLARVAKEGKDKGRYKEHLEAARKLDPKNPEIQKEIKEGGF